MTKITPENPDIYKNILAVVLAGGKGSRLRPLTASIAKPALPFGGSFRLVDFVLSNLINSGIDSIYLLAQYKPESLIKHITANWQLAPNGHVRFVRVVLPRREHGGGFRGTADAVYQNLDLIERHAPNMVAVFAADHIYRMDVRQMVDFHRECNADVTVAMTQVPIEKASSFGIIATGYMGEILDFQEKPDLPIAIPSSPEYAYASMGNYLFNTDVLVEGLEHVLRCGETDFGTHTLPRLIQSHHVHAYDFSRNSVPGTQPYEEQAYWRDVGTLEAYVAAHQDISGSLPRFNLQNPHWPILPTIFAKQPASFGTSHVQYKRDLFDLHPSMLCSSGNLSPAESEALQIGTA
ncbi:MAG: NTP transferase domain-containing protein [Nitrosomonadales bacterium]|nr:NTP transferase domain-containing protein [Nitrosomonadales bacterium]